MTKHAVVIAGGGPTGLMLAGELALAGVDVVIVERRADQEVDGSRAGGLYPRTLEVLDQRGIADRFVAAGFLAPQLGFGGILLDVTDLPTRHHHVLALWQREFEPILAGWVEELGVPILHRREVTGFVQDDAAVRVEISDGSSIGAEYLVGCDGGRSVVRKAAGIDFPGVEASTGWIIAEAEMDEEPEIGLRREGGGIGPVNRQGGGGRYRVVLTEEQVEHADEPTLADLSATLVRVYGTDFGLRRASWMSRFTDMARQAAAYRQGRVLLAGDAAHVHAPHGGQGLNTGVQDAVNLGWKLAQVVHGTSPESLLDTFQAERHPVGARVLRNSMAMVALTNPDDRHHALRDIVGELLSLDEARRQLAATITALDLHYDLGEGHPLLGRRIPDLDLELRTIPGGPTRVFELLHDGQPVLLDLGAAGGFDIGPWAERVRLIEASGDGVVELPALGQVTMPPAVLIRPDGHVAWTGEPNDPELPRALETWFGAPRPTSLSGRSTPLRRGATARPTGGLNP